MVIKKVLEDLRELILRFTALNGGIKMVNNKRCQLINCHELVVIFCDKN